MINKILIANRSEIACRVIRTAKNMGINTVAVYSEADAQSQHVKMADEAVLLGPAPASESYLKADRIITEAKRLGVDAIHPGYGFLSENAAFSQACADNGIAFIGPGPDAISAMGSKSAAKTIMENAGVPLVPGYHGDNQDPEFLHEQAKQMGYPVLLKAAAGGGGKGMRQVHNDADFHAALDAAKREAQASFGDQHMLIEKYLTEPRHVEIQVFCDNHGNGVYLFERDCSVQRRHQKIIEEAPAPNMPDDIRTKMGEAALKAAHAISYSGAGTVEFLFDSDGQFYFMEMNTRLQVEHPVTEMITGEDLVDWQIQVANNLPLPKTQEQLQLSGHAFEARIYAEDPENEFLPATGTLSYLTAPQGHNIRVDTGVVQGDEVSIYYDPMIAKLIVYGENRETALSKLVYALHQYHIVGVTTNIDYLLRVAQSDAFRTAQLTTDFVERHQAALESQKTLPDASMQAAISFIILQSAHSQSVKDRDSALSAVLSPFSSLRGFRSNHAEVKQVSFTVNEQTFTLDATRAGTHAWSVKLGDESIHCIGDVSENTAVVEVGTQRMQFRFHRSDNTLSLFTTNGLLKVNLPQADFAHDDDAPTAGAITAPMNGTLVSMLVSPGQTVSKGDAIAIVEAMKMEHSLKAPFDANVQECFFKAGDRVDGGAVLLELTPLEE